MLDSIEKRISLVKESDDYDHLVKHLCPFYTKGGHPDCVTCKVTEDTLAECKEYYLDRITKTPMDIWCEDFDKLLVTNRNKVSLDEVIGVGINCDSCYMYDKCSLFKKGYACGIDWAGDIPKTPEDVYEFLVSTQFERVRRASVFEKIDGGVPDASLSGEMDRLSTFVDGKANLNRERLSINVEASGSATSAGGGILAQLFGGGRSASLPSAEDKAIPKDAMSLKDSSIEDAIIIEDIPKLSRHDKRKAAQKEMQK